MTILLKIINSHYDKKILNFFVNDTKPKEYTVYLNNFTVDVRDPPSFYYDPDDRYRRDCGGSTGPNEISGEVKSPGFPFTYPRNVTCNWYI
jgi:hypothetical protein